MNPIYRKDAIVEICRGKSVLHLGFIQHSHLYKKLIEEGNWLHDKIADVSRKLVGIDYLEEDVEWFRQNTSYEVYTADVTKLENWQYDETFDVIVCGELLEHLENPGLMLKGIKRLMNNNSEVIITTPNPWSRNRLKLVSKGTAESSWVNPEHTCWFSYQTLKQMLKRCGFEELAYDYYFGETHDEFYPVQNKLLRPVAALKQNLIKLTLPERKYTGLFFRAVLKKT